MAEDSKFHPDLVRQLAEVLNETDLNEIEYEIKNHRIRVVRHNKETHVYPAQQQPILTPPQTRPTPVEVIPIAREATDWNTHVGAVKSPMVGNAYLSPEPGAPPFAPVGAEVKEGQTLLVIEAMKVMNPIKAPKSGKVTKVFVSDASPVEYDEVLMIIE